MVELLKIRKRIIRNPLVGAYKEVYYLFTIAPLFDYLWTNPYKTIENFWDIMKERRKGYYIEKEIYGKKYYLPLKFIFGNNLGVVYDNKDGFKTSGKIYLKLKKRVWFVLDMKGLHLFDDEFRPIELSSVLIYPEIRKQIYAIEDDDVALEFAKGRYIYPIIVRYKLRSVDNLKEYVPKWGYKSSDVNLIIKLLEVEENGGK